MWSLKAYFSKSGSLQQSASYDWVEYLFNGFIKPVGVKENVSVLRIMGSEEAGNTENVSRARKTFLVVFLVKLS